MSMIRVSAVLLLVLCLGSLAFAQGGATGAISGVVQDASGAVIANAKVSVTSEATGEVVRQMKTDTSGLFTAELLSVGNYTVEVNAAGFPVTKFPNVPVRITETTRITANLKLSAVRKLWKWRPRRSKSIRRMPPRDNRSVPQPLALCRWLRAISSSCSTFRQAPRPT